MSDIFGEANERYIADGMKHAHYESFLFFGYQLDDVSPDHPFGHWRPQHRRFDWD